MDNTYKTICSMTKAVFYDNTTILSEGIDWKTVFFEMDRQKIATLAGDIIGRIQMDDTKALNWKKYMISNRVAYEQMLHEQSNIFKLLDGIPAAVLKGTAAAVYYPMPYSRTMGDIDILVDCKNYVKARNILNSQYQHIYNNEIKHTKFRNGNIEIELHKGMASMYVGAKQEYFDGMLFAAMDCLEKRTIGGSEFYMFPKTENGLILLRHMHQHLQEGIGLRHVIDWMAYLVDKEPVDWNRFNTITQEMGIYTLQCVLTRICEIYLGLEHRQDLNWCSEADEKLCERLMDYFTSRGNFGRAVDNIAGKFASGGVRGNVIKRLQLGGMCRWKAAQKHKILRPFAWMYQSVRISREMFGMDKPLEALQKEIKEAEQVKKLMEELGLECQKAWVKQDDIRFV